MLLYAKIREDRWSKWRRMDLWDLESAISLWTMHDPDQAIDRQMMTEFMMKPLRDMAIAAVLSGKLKPHVPSEDPAKAFFEPRVFILWAQTKGLPTPKWWDELLNASPEEIIQQCYEENITDPHDIALILDDTFTGDRALSHPELGRLLPADPNITISIGAQRDRGKRLRGLKK